MPRAFGPKGSDAVIALEDFNRLAPDAAAARLLTACHSARWAATVAAGRPYADLASLQQVADGAWRRLGSNDWREALDGHPRIGESGGKSPAYSEQEQAGLAGLDDAVRAAIAQNNRAYEQRFGHVFLISAAGLGPEEILANLQSRLANDPATELQVAAEQHARITRLRLEMMFD
ncbi:MAG: 2-oxo-4-hydroxy-4-carboxy-5-ureidoimidazoline decarboxylase [Actinomycetota bacterium]|nr:2-oxo-4-hydroxy-4-carboxy-5-ureidoimidazoline decarboxylase [Actinomycetota bacterium]